MSRITYLLGVGIALVALAFTVTDNMLGSPAGVTAATAERIKPGMTLSEVQAVLGGPPSYQAVGGMRRQSSASTTYYWLGQTGYEDRDRCLPAQGR